MGRVTSGAVTLEGGLFRGARPDPAPARRSCQIAWAEASLLVNLEFVGSLSLSLHLLLGQVAGNVDAFQG